MVNKCEEICQILNNDGNRSFIDKRDNKNPRYKFSECELKGVPVGLEIGPKDMKGETLMAARRDEGDNKGRLEIDIFKKELVFWLGSSMQVLTKANYE